MKKRYHFLEPFRKGKDTLNVIKIRKGTVQIKYCDQVFERAKKSEYVTRKRFQKNTLFGEKVQKVQTVGPPNFAITQW